MGVFERFFLLAAIISLGATFLICMIEFFIRGKMSMIGTLLARYRKDDDAMAKKFEERVMTDGYINIPEDKKTKGKK